MQQTRQEMAPSKSWWWNSTNFIGICWWKWFYCWLLYKNFEWKDFEWKDFEPSIIFYFFTIRKMIRNDVVLDDAFVFWRNDLISHDLNQSRANISNIERAVVGQIKLSARRFNFHMILLHREFFWWLVVRITYFHGVTRDTEPWRRIGFQYRSST